MPVLLETDISVTHIPWYPQLLSHYSTYIFAASFLALPFLVLGWLECRKDRRRKSHLGRTACGFSSFSQWVWPPAAGRKPVSWAQRAPPLWLVSAQALPARASREPAAAGFSGPQGSAMEEHHAAGSRGVSRSLGDSAAESDLSTFSLSPFPAQGSPADHHASTTRSPILLSSSSPRRSADGSGTGKGNSMDGDFSWASSGAAGPAMTASATTQQFFDTTDDQYVSYRDVPLATAPSDRGNSKHVDHLTFTRPPPLSPLTRPTSDLSFATQFHASFGDRCWPPPPTSSTIPAELDAHAMSGNPTSYIDIHQPNPDYHVSAGTSSRADVAAGGNALASAAMVGTAHYTPSSTASGIPRRRSYTKSIHIPASGRCHDGATSGHSITTSRPAEFFSPSSYPSSWPLLPPPPPGQYHDFVDEPEVMLGGYDGDAGFGEHGHVDGGHAMDGHGGQVDVHGQMISVTDDSGAGWKRHTRVYGGGVCLACAASGGGGGFYGASVRPEDKFKW